ncbi:uncharacterized protein LOC129594337 [Paramacrobiotus metropolitanus]|uniref:uncharacterized protein LOC129594337 n=1 Tax=Paramacrobiotus metropolitanus TaxID=2943436 RepID=UPI0024461981|nr:uncharacterized protein LOC129594337 [Paramacrobiotus metropolitanus]XP_055346964.1 uncharacterized protein LOC129594337 [Paramacrobiotus metropolitanus]
MAAFVYLTVLSLTLAMIVNGQRMQEMLPFGKSKTIQCNSPAAPNLNIVLAVYAAAPPAPNLPHPPKPCAQTDNFAALTKLCNGKKQCTLVSNDPTKTGPCGKRFLMVTYQCQPSKSKG